MNGKRAALLFGLATLVLSSAPMAADKVTTMPVEFSKGTSTASLKGAIKGADAANYTLGAIAGQFLTVRITGSPNANLSVLAPGSEPQALSLEPDGRSFSGRLPATGQYVIQISQGVAAARKGTASPYALEIEMR